MPCLSGFCTMLINILQRAPRSVAVSFDVSKVFRHDEYAGYKAHRVAMPEELRSRIGRVREVVERFGFPIYQMRGYEADDVINSLAKKLEAEGHETVIVTGDTDMLQLVTDRVSGRCSEPRPVLRGAPVRPG